MMIKIALLVLVGGVMVIADVCVTPEEIDNICDTRKRYESCMKESKTSICRYRIYAKKCTGWEKDEILNAINVMRSYFYNGLDRHIKSGQLNSASAVPDLKWSDTLAQQALQWAAQCKPGLDKCLNLAPGYVGQTKNSSITDVKPDHPVAIVDRWYDNEMEYFDRKLIAKFNPDPETFNKVSNLTQILWSRTKEVGCARVVEEIGDERFKTTLVCNWKPSGNIFGKYVYEIKASQWNEDERKRYHDLHLSQ